MPLLSYCFCCSHNTPHTLRHTHSASLALVLKLVDTGPDHYSSCITEPEPPAAPYSTRVGSSGMLLSWGQPEHTGSIEVRPPQYFALQYYS